MNVSNITSSLMGSGYLPVIATVGISAGIAFCAVKIIKSLCCSTDKTFERKVVDLTSKRNDTEEVLSSMRGRRSSTAIRGRLVSNNRTTQSSTRGGRFGIGRGGHIGNHSSISSGRGGHFSIRGGRGH